MGETKPVPFPRGEEESWFQAAQNGAILYQQCAQCGAIASYPRTVCPSCWSPALVNKTSAGRGVVHTFTVQYRTGAPGFADEVPYTLVLVDLDEGARVLADLRGCEENSLAIGMRVEAYFEPGPGNVVLPRFRPAAREATA